MELVFIYIVGLDDDFIRNQGFNFSSNYNFYVRMQKYFAGEFF